MEYSLADLSRRKDCMPVEPLPDDIVARLRSDRTAALAAAVIVAGAFPGIVSWAARVFCVSSDAGGHPCEAGGVGARSNDEGGGGTGGSNGASGKHGAVSPSLRPPTQTEDQLLALMRANPGATIAQLVELSGRSRSAIVICLKRLEEAGLVDHGGRGSWTVADADLVDAAPPSTTPSWLTPLSGNHAARFAADGRVREEMATMRSS